jgi:hypothetical protein
MPHDTDSWRHAEAGRRQSLCEAANQLMLSNPPPSQNEIARALGVDAASLSRYRRAYAAGGYAGLLPGISSGRRSLREQLAAAVGPEAVADLEKKVLGRALDMDGSDGAAWRKIARSPSTPAPVREYFAKVETSHASKHTIARSLRRATRVSPQMLLAHSGSRALRLGGAWTPRHLDILPGDIFSSDDTTAIWGCYIEVEPCEKYRTGYKMAQVQLLPVIDVASQAVVCFAMIARETGAYRASDVWRLIGYTHRTIGVPRLGWQKERGSWEAGLVEGVEVTVGEGDFSHTARVGGLRMLPSSLLPYHVDKMNGAGFKTLQTFTSYLPKSKSIEGVLHRLQKFEGTLWGSLGRDQRRKPFEKAQKTFGACQRGTARAPLHFLSLSEISRKYVALLEDYHAEPIQGEVFQGKPLEVWERGLTEHGTLRPPPAETGYLYRGDWARVKIARGLARIRRQNHELGRQVSFYYEAPELFARPDVDGRDVLIYFDRDAFEQPADVLSVGGEWLGHAHYFQPPGMFLDGDASGHEERRASREAVTAIYQSVLPHIPSRQLPAEIAARRAAARSAVAIVDDGRGRAASIETGGLVQVAELANASDTDAATARVDHREKASAWGFKSLPAHRATTPAPADNAALLADIARQEAELEESGAFST